MSDIGLDLILAEERRRQDRVVVEDDDSPVDTDLLVIERQNFTTSDAFTLKEPGNSLPLDGPGDLSSLVVSADSDQYDVFLKVDDQVVVNDSWTNVESISGELTRIGAFQDSDDNRVFSASDYSFRDELDAVITPQASVTFSLQRVEVDLYGR